MRSYYLHDGVQQNGPFSLDELKFKNLTPKTPVWYDGLGDWRPAEQIAELQTLLTQPPPFLKPNPPVYKETKTKILDEAYETLFPAKRKIKLPFIVAGVLFVGLIIWLIYTNRSQAAIIDEVKQEKREEETTKNFAEEERKRINEEITRKNMNYRNNWSEYISVKHSDYRYSNLGGIYGLAVIVVNNTDYLLDEVQVDITYVKANGGKWKTITVPITNVPAHSKKSVPLDDVERGTSVEMSANTIYSKKMHFYYSSEYNSGNNNDPYFYK